ncbi:MAG: sulfite exporter TauE/SafE family protein [Oscillospiraceae bacterium]
MNFLGFIAGIINGMFGAGGGLFLVPALKRKELTQKQAQATSVSIILPICVVSVITYLIKGIKTNPLQLFLLSIGGIVGGIIGSILLKRIKNIILRKIFAIIMIMSAVRLLIK